MGDYCKKNYYRRACGRAVDKIVRIQKDKKIQAIKKEVLQQDKLVETQPAVQETKKENSRSVPSTFDPEILDSFDLELKQAAITIEHQFEADYQGINDSLQQLKASESLKNLELQFNDVIKQLAQKDAKSSKRAFDNLLSEAKQLKAEITGHQKELRALVAKQKQSVSILKRARDADYKALKATVQLDSYKSGNVSETLFGQELAEKITTGVQYSMWAKKVIQRLASSDKEIDKTESKGVAFQFGSQPILPRIWFKKI